jgi:hypothetical protein
MSGRFFARLAIWTALVAAMTLYIGWRFRELFGAALLDNAGELAFDLAMLALFSAVWSLLVWCLGGLVMGDGYEVER